ncbi:hypothetical protein RJ55_06221 [Drechmeria coniospora]|nr:hypothetical protein RJ55_06221 [Drechmeria coniospora]
MQPKARSPRVPVDTVRFWNKRAFVSGMVRSGHAQRSTGRARVGPAEACAWNVPDGLGLVVGEGRGRPSVEARMAAFGSNHGRKRFMAAAASLAVHVTPGRLVSYREPAWRTGRPLCRQGVSAEQCRPGQLPWCMEPPESVDATGTMGKHAYCGDRNWQCFKDGHRCKSHIRAAGRARWLGSVVDGQGETRPDRETVEGSTWGCGQGKCRGCQAMPASRNGDEAGNRVDSCGSHRSRQSRPLALGSVSGVPSTSNHHLREGQ